MSFDYELPSGWSWETIDSIKAQGRSIVSGPFGSAIGSRFFVESGVPVIRGNNLKLGMQRFCDNGFVFLSDEKALEFKNCEALRDDIVLTAAGTIGQVGIIPSAAAYPKYIISNKQIRVRTDKEKVIPLFVYYWLSSPEMTSTIQSRNTGSTVPLINLSVVKSLPIPVPPLKTQSEIVEVLGCLDDRITLLQETNATLEAIVKALFKSWFVDFDPVQANAGTQAPSLPPEIQALFPATFTDSSQGPIPEGWHIGKVEDLMELAYGKALKATDRVDGDVPVYGSGGITGSHNQALVAGPSIIVGRKGTVGSLYWEDRPFFPIDTVFYVKSDKPLSYCFYLLQTLGLQDMNTDGAVPGLNRNNAYRLPVAIPSNGVLHAFDETVAIIRESIFTNNQQAISLASLRDTLLPRLISGHLHLPAVKAVNMDEV